MAQIIIACLFLWVCLLCLLFYFIGLPHFTFAALPLCCWLTCSFDKGCVQFCVAEDLMQQTGWQCLVVKRMAILMIAQRGPLHDTTDNWVAPISSVSCVGYRLPLFLLFMYMCCARQVELYLHVRAGTFCWISCNFSTIYIYTNRKVDGPRVKLSVHRLGCALCHAQSGVVAEIVWQAVSYSLVCWVLYFAVTAISCDTCEIPLPQEKDACQWGSVGG